MKDGVLLFACPRCGDPLEVGLHLTAFPTEPTQVGPSATHYSHPVEFVAEAPHLHAEFWGHLVSCHQPNPHPYMDSGVPGELEATRALLKATQEQLHRTVSDFGAVRDALPREQVAQILASVEE